MPDPTPREADSPDHDESRPLGDVADDPPVVPVFYPIPEPAAARAIERFQRVAERGRAGDAPEEGFLSRPKRLSEYLFDEIEQRSVIYVDGQPLAEYASDAGVDTLAIDPE